MYILLPFEALNTLKTSLDKHTSNALSLSYIHEYHALYKVSTIYFRMYTQCSICTSLLHGLTFVHSTIRIYLQKTLDNTGMFLLCRIKQRRASRAIHCIHIRIVLQQYSTSTKLSIVRRVMQCCIPILYRLPSFFLIKRQNTPNSGQSSTAFVSSFFRAITAACPCHAAV